MKRALTVITIVLLLVVPSKAAYKDFFKRHFVDKPWSGAPLIRESVCIDCHSSRTMKPRYLKIHRQWKMSIHKKYRVSCHNCHGGDPSDSAKGCESPHGGYFVGRPKSQEIPRMCGKCHIGILKEFTISKHGVALKKGNGPNCVTCHGSHSVQKADINIINVTTCTKCHEYKRAEVIKDALRVIEEKMSDLEKEIRVLKSMGTVTEDIEKALFRTRAEFRTLFHTVDVTLVKQRTEDFSEKLKTIRDDLLSLKREIRFRRSFSGYLLGVFVFMLILYHYSDKRK